ncbi:hypothetical protein MRX96_028270 [Rhipicephalus microplus]
MNRMTAPRRVPKRSTRKKKGCYKRYAALQETSATRSKAVKRSPLRVQGSVGLRPATLPVLRWCQRHKSPSSD